MQPSANAVKSAALVAGGAGFLGSHLCEALLHQGLAVICCDNLSIGKKENIAHLLKDPNFHFLEHDITKPIPPNFSIEVVFHLAGSLEHSGSKASISTLIVNSLGTYNLLEFAKEKGAKFVLASSARLSPSLASAKDLRHYFGLDSEAENYLSLQEAKRFAESLTSEYIRNYNLDGLVVRLADVFGPRMDLDSPNPLNSLLKQALRKEEMTVWGDGLNNLYPTYVQDVVFGILKTLYSERVRGQILYLVNPQKITQISLAEEIKSLVESSREIVKTEIEEEIEDNTVRFDPKSTQELLSWQPKVSLSAGLKQTLSYFQKKTQPQKEEIETVLGQPEPETVVEPVKEERVSIPVKFPKVKKSYLKGIIVSSCIALVVLVLISPLLSSLIHSRLAFASLRSSLEYFHKNHFQQSAKSSEAALKHFRTANTELGNLNTVLTLFSQKSLIQNWEKHLQSGDNLSSGLKAASLALTNLENIVKLARSERSSDAKSQIKVNLAETKINLELALKEITLAELSLKNKPFENIPFLIDSQDKEVGKRVFFLREGLETLNSLHSNLVDWLSLDNQEKHYLLVFVDNHSQLTTPGAVSEVGLLKVSNGQFNLRYLPINSLKETPLQGNSPGPDLLSLRSSLEKNLSLKSDGIVVLNRYSLEKLSGSLGLGVSGAATALTLGRSVLEKIMLSSSGELILLGTQIKPLLEERHLLAQSETPLLANLLDQRVLGLRFPEALRGEDYLYLTKNTLSKPELGVELETDFRYLLKVSPLGETSVDLTLNFFYPSSQPYQGLIKIFRPLGELVEKAQKGKQEKLKVQSKEVGKWQLLEFPLEVRGRESVILNLKPPFKISLLRETPYTLVVPKSPGEDKIKGELFFDLPALSRLSQTDPIIDTSTRPYRVPISSSHDFVFQSTISKN